MVHPRPVGRSAAGDGVSSGNATIVHRYPGSFQAPNWTRDGKALIYAQEGRLYRFDLASREVYRVLKVGGRAIFSEPVRDSRLLRAARRCK